MRLPAETGHLTLQVTQVRHSAYPPLGFLPFPEHELGNGDCFGLYWPIGQEDTEPIVAEIGHDSWSLCPAFSSVEAFLRLASEGERDWVEPPTLDQDPESVFASFQQAKADLRGRNFDSATALLERVVSRLPEFAEAQTSYLGQLSRLRRTDEAFEAAVNGAIGLPCLGGPSQRALAWLRKQTSCPSDFEDDPIWRSRDRLDFRFGGTKTNETVSILKAAIDAYLEQDLSVRAVTLMQTYGELMCRETVSFRRRYEFEVESFLDLQRETCRSLGMARDIFERQGAVVAAASIPAVAADIDRRSPVSRLADCLRDVISGSR